MTVILWFKRDLRLHDHAALTHAAARAPVLPLYIAESALWAQPDASARQWDFVAESLAELDMALARRGLGLVVRRGDAVGVLADLCATHGVDEIVSHEETGNLWTYARDRRVAAWARDAGIRWTEIPGQGVVRRLASRDGWAKGRDARMAAPVLPVPAMTGVTVAPGAIPTAAELGLAPDPCPGRQTGGRRAGIALLDSFLTDRAEGYRRGMSSPLTGASACSRLSPHLAWGTLSGREVAHAVARRRADLPDGAMARSLDAFAARLAWRDHFAQKLEDEPEIEHRCLDPATEDLRRVDASRLAAWEAGETGLPFLDACIRSLRATGWINFRMRSMVMAAASYHLWLDWRATGPVLARLFTDYDPGIHWPQVQMQSGTTGINTIRIYNPVKQGHDQDPSGTFVRRWVPELAQVPDAALQEPWRWDGAGRLRYPPPVVEPAAAARQARDRIWALRRAPDHRAVAAEILRRHASRADGSGRFVNDRAGARRGQGRSAGDMRQLKLDL
jgi:deoxyribodipyrimidine photo-lyase